MKIIALILSLLLLTSCSNPDTSGGVTLSRGGGDDANEFPYGDCEGQGKNPTGGETGCGWVHVNEESHYILPEADLDDANLSGADLRYAHLGYANLSGADLSGADLSGARLWYVGANSSTTCPNGIKWRTEGYDCPF